MSVAERVDHFCRRYGDGEFDDLDGAAAAALARILELVRGGKSGDALVPDLETLDSAIVALGDDGLTTGPRSLRSIPGLSGHSIVYAWRCPVGVCSRRHIDFSGDDEPDPCPILGKALKRVRLDP